MSNRVAVQARPSVAARFGAFVLERHPFAAAAAVSALEVLADTCGDLTTADAIERTRARLPQALRRALPSPPPALPETTPAVAAAARWTAAVDELVEACDGFLRRAAIEASLTADERREILRGMALTRATDNRLKTVLHRRRRPLRRGRVPGQGLPVARAGSDLRRRHPAAPRRRRSAHPTAGAATSSRR